MVRTCPTCCVRLPALLLMLALCLTGCGGGGGDTAPGPPTLSVSTNALSATVAPTDLQTVLAVHLTIANPATTFNYKLFRGGSAVFATNLVRDSTPPNSPCRNARVGTFRPGLIGSGTYQDTVKINVCTDPACDHPIQGSPATISVTYTVTGNAISNATYALQPTSVSVESATNAPVDPSSTVEVITSGLLPPYAAYVSLSSRSDGPIAGLTFKQQTSGNPVPHTYGTGLLTVLMKSPASLGPGVYSDLIKLSICYDNACTKPAVGSPLEIPVTYTVTASVGREFQERYVDQNLTALAADATGQFLYGVTAPANVDSPNPTAAQLLKIEPLTGAVTTLLSLPAAVQQIAVSQDDAYLYLLTEPWSGTQQAPPVGVLRVRTADLSIDQTVGLTSNTVAQIAVSPVDSNAWSAAFSDQPNAWKVELFDGQVARANTWSVTSGVVYGNQGLWSSDASRMYVLDANLSAVAVDAAGLGAGTLLQAGSAGQAGFNLGGNFQLAGGLLYSANGGVLDPSTNTVVGQYSFPADVPYARLSVDPVNNRTFAAYTTRVGDSEQGTIESFNRSTFSPIWIARLPAGAPIRWGGDGLAWIGPGVSTGRQALYIINGTFVAP